MALLAAIGLIVMLFLPLGIVFLEEVTTGTSQFERFLRMVGVHHALGEIYEAVGLID